MPNLAVNAKCGSVGSHRGIAGKNQPELELWFKRLPRYRWTESDPHNQWQVHSIISGIACVALNVRTKCPLKFDW